MNTTRLLRARSPWLLTSLAVGTALLALAGQGCSDDAETPMETAGAGGTTGGAAGSSLGGQAGSTTAGTAGTGGSKAGSAGSTAGTGGSTAGASGTAGTAGASTGGTAGASTGGTAGAAGTTGGTAGAAGTTGGTAGTAGAGGSTAGAAGAAGTGGQSASGFVYLETNDPAGNAVLAFSRAADGTLTPLPGGSFPTGGAGLANPKQRLGPADSDLNFAWSADKKRLFAVNSGASSIAVFDLNPDGSLKAVTGSPFSSGGKNPVSIALHGSFLFVVNKEADGESKPSYVTLGVGADGALTPFNMPPVQTPLGGSPTMAYIPPGKNLLFGTQFLDADRIAMVSPKQIDAFLISPSGSLTPAAGAPYALPADTSGKVPPPPPVALDLIGHPTEDILYVGFPARGEVGVYTYDTTGVPTFVHAAKNSGAAICWLRTTADGKRLYTVNSGSATLSVYDLTDPLHPTETSHLELKGDKSGTPFVDAMGMMQTLTSNPFQFELDPTETHLYVVSQRVTTVDSDKGGNQLHTLAIAADGTLSEPGEPLDLATLGVPPTARPQGIAVR